MFSASVDWQPAASLPGGSDADVAADVAAAARAAASHEELCASLAYDIAGNNRPLTSVLQGSRCGSSCEACAAEQPHPPWSAAAGSNSRLPWLPHSEEQHHLPLLLQVVTILMANGIHLAMLDLITNSIRPSDCLAPHYDRCVAVGAAQALAIMAVAVEADSGGALGPQPSLKAVQEIVRTVADTAQKMLQTVVSRSNMGGQQAPSSAPAASAASGNGRRRAPVRKRQRQQQGLPQLPACTIAVVAEASGILSRLLLTQPTEIGVPIEVPQSESCVRLLAALRLLMRTPPQSLPAVLPACLEACEALQAVAVGSDPEAAMVLRGEASGTSWAIVSEEISHSLLHGVGSCSGNTGHLVQTQIWQLAEASKQLSAMVDGLPDSSSKPS